MGSYFNQGTSQQPMDSVCFWSSQRSLWGLPNLIYTHMEHPPSFCPMALDHFFLSGQMKHLFAVSLQDWTRVTSTRIMHVVCLIVEETDSCNPLGSAQYQNTHGGGRPDARWHSGDVFFFLSRVGDVGMLCIRPVQSTALCLGRFNEFIRLLTARHSQSQPSFS